MEAIRPVAALFVFFVIWPPSLARAQPVSLPPAPTGVVTFTREGIQFSRVQAPNVQAFVPSNGNVNRPIGGGSWDFGIARTELTQGQWAEFLNAMNAVPITQDQPWTSGMNAILTGVDGAGPGMYFNEVGPQGRGIWQTTELGAALPVRMIGWFGAAVYCNWLNSGRQVTMNALLDGAYNLHQWDLESPATWSTITREAGAQYWIPTYDEWAVASFYDHARYGPGVPGWWSYVNGLNRASIPGPPGTGETSANWNPRDDGYPFQTEWLIPVAAYSNSQSPWGLFDTSGSFPEILDDIVETGRMYAGTITGPPGGLEPDTRLDTPGWIGVDYAIGDQIGFRIASWTVPEPTGAMLLLGAISFRCRRSRSCIQSSLRYCSSRSLS